MTDINCVAHWSNSAFLITLGHFPRNMVNNNCQQINWNGIWIRNRSLINLNHSSYKCNYTASYNRNGSNTAIYVPVFCVGFLGIINPKVK